MEKGQSQSKANKGMRRFISGRSFAVLFAPILLSMLVFNHLKKKKRIAEKESTEGASAPFFSTEGVGPYDVFLSFRGSDTRKGFTDYLCCSLRNVGTMPICVFRDDDSLLIGEKFGPRLLDAITQSKILIPIISENYASSKWCLRELVHIMECKKSTSHIVLPIFYKVDPSDVRYLKGNFGRAFDSRKKRFDENDIQQGRRALREVSELMGWESEKIANGCEGELVEKVIKMVLSKLRPDFHLDLTEHLVGFGDHVKKIRNWIDTSAGDARMIGIYGMGGIGKTTLAKVIYNELSNDFRYCSFLLDIRETACEKKIPYLQKQLIKKIRSIEDEVLTIDDGKNLIKANFKGKKVLILLDDVDDEAHLNALAGQRNWFTSGSIIIVTTRYKAVLDQSRFKVGCMYELNEIDMEHSLILFKKHAFREDPPLTGFKGISNEIVSTLGGLPLALEVIGSHLYRKTQSGWVEILKQLKKQPYRDVQEVLKISYDALDANQQEIFLDIACFFIGNERKFTTYMWEDRQVYANQANQAIEELELRCLIKIGDGGILRMHDQLRDLGRSIRKGNEASKVPIEKKDTDEQFINLQSSRFLQSREAPSSEDFSEIRWLRLLDIDPNLSFSTTNLPLPRLVVLQLSYNRIKEDWTGWTLIMAARQLKVLDLACCEYLKCTPDLSVLMELEILILKGCQRLEQVHPSIGKVKSLVSLDLSGCGSLKELSGEVCKLEELKELIIDSTGITEIPKSIAFLSKLEKLSARTCLSLGEIPSSIWGLQKLHYLDISKSVIEKLPGIEKEKPGPTAFAEVELILKDCYRLEQVDPSIGKVKSLVSLDLSGCGSLKKLPREVDELEELKELILDSTGITQISKSIGSLSKLEKLSAKACRSLREIDSSIWYLQNLQYLDVSESAIEKLPSVNRRLKKPDFTAFTGLEIILKDCYKLEQVDPSIGKVKSLVSLDLSGCGSLKKLPGEVGELEELKELILDSTGITEISMSINSLSKLEKLSVRACRSLREIDGSIWYLQNLRYLDISESAIEKLPSVNRRLKKPDFTAFAGLEIILKDCYKLEQVDPSIGKVKSLVSLDLSGCGSLKKLPGEVGELEELKELILDSSGITEIPMSINSLSKLEKLSARACQSLREIPDSIGNLQNLQHLDISDSAIEKLPSAIGRLKKLRKLSLESCCSLKGEIPREIGNLSSLEILQLSGTLISDLPKSIQNLSSLQHLSLEGCHKLRSVPELPSGLKFLRISSRSPRLPQGFCPIHLETLYVSWRRSGST